MHASKKMPKNVHTIFSFNLPYAILIPDGRYLVRIGKHVAEIAIKRLIPISASERHKNYSSKR